MDWSSRALPLFVTHSDMDERLLSELEFFPSSDKTASSVAAAAGAVQPNGGNFGPGALGLLYQNEESVDFSSWIPDVFSEVPTVVTVPSPRGPVSGTTNTHQQQQHHRSYREAPVTTSAPAAAGPFSFGSYCSPATPQPAPSANSTAACGINMYDTENAAAAGISLPHSQTTITSLTDHSFLSDSLMGTRPAPGKAPKKPTKKKMPDKNTKEYREKRERNNIAVRKSREKNRQQIMETQRRVKELEEENSALQSKIALLSKELKVLKDLFSSAGVTQPPSLCLKPEPDN